jgi:hypothetical protein
MQKCYNAHSPKKCPAITWKSYKCQKEKDTRLLFVKKEKKKKKKKKYSASFVNVYLSVAKMIR